MAAHPALKIAEEWSHSRLGLPLAVLAGGTLLYHGLRKGRQRDATADQARDQAVRDAAAQRNAGVVGTLRGGSPLNPAGAAIYNNEMAQSADIGDTLMFDKGAMAQLQRTCTAVSKQAGIGGAVLGAVSKVNRLPDLLGKPLGAVGRTAVKGMKAITPSMGTGTKLMLGAGAAGLGYGAYKAGKGVYNYGMQQNSPHTRGGHAAHLPMYSNQFGVPTMG